MKTIVSMLALFALMIACDSPGPSPDARTAEPDPNAHAFYYPWWGNPETDGAYFHWNHEILGVGSKTRSYPGGDDIGANFYPELGCYSSHDSATVNTHMKQLKQAGIGTICVSWWGPDSFEDKAIPLILDKAANHGIKVNFHIEPFEGRNAATTRDAIIYLTDTYGAHPAFQRDPRYNNRPFLYIYDSYKTPASEWATILDPAGTNTIRGTAYDAVMIALWVEPHEEDFILQGNFDGFYTYFVSDSFSYGSSPSTWPKLSSWAKQNDKVFVPCVGPGYSDTRIRPWNHSNYRSRDGGKYYDRMFTTAINVKPPVIGVTSFNEWHEGTQIEPAVPYAAGEYVYEDYEPRPNDYYLHRTRYWVDKIGQIIPV